MPKEKSTKKTASLRVDPIGQPKLGIKGKSNEKIAKCRESEEEEELVADPDIVNATSFVNSKKEKGRLYGDEEQIKWTDVQENELAAEDEDEYEYDQDEDDIEADEYIEFDGDNVAAAGLSESEVHFLPSYLSFFHRY